MKNFSKPLLLVILLFSVVGLYGDESVKDIFKGFDPVTLTEEQAIGIMEAIRDAGFRGGPELDELIRAEGFDPEIIKKLAPPPAPPDDHPVDNHNPPNKQKGSGKSYSSLSTDYGTPSFKIKSEAIDNGELLETYKCEEKIHGVENSIPLSWDNVPDGTKSLAIVMYHYPNPNDKTRANSYLLLWGIDPVVKGIPYGEADDGNWFMGQNKDGIAISYTSPCSPSAGIHEYIITMFALAGFPEPLPRESSLDINFDLFMTAIESVEILGKAYIIFNDTNR